MVTLHNLRDENGYRNLVSVSKMVTLIEFGNEQSIDVTTSLVGI